MRQRLTWPYSGSVPGQTWKNFDVFGFCEPLELDHQCRTCLTTITNSINMSDFEDVFVTGRLCLLGEHSGKINYIPWLFEAVFLCISLTLCRLGI